MNITITELYHDPFKGVDKEKVAYDHAAHCGAWMGMGTTKPLIVEHTLVDPTMEQIEAKVSEMKEWLKSIVFASKSVADLKCPFEKSNFYGR